MASAGSAENRSIPIDWRCCRAQSCVFVAREPTRARAGDSALQRRDQQMKEQTMERESWTYLTAPEDLWAKVEDNGVAKEVRVIAIGVHQNVPMLTDKDDKSQTVLLIAEPDNRWDRELSQQWVSMSQVHRLYFRSRRRLGR